MNFETNSNVGPHGDLFIRLPASFSNRRVHIKIGEPTGEDRPGMTPEEWRAFLDKVTGTVSDPTFERPEQVVLENRVRFE